MKFIGIDPDVCKSGFVIWDSEKQRFDEISCYSFFDVLHMIEGCSDLSYVAVEAGWLNKKSNFHYRKGQSRQVGEKIAKSVGANHQVGKLIVEFCTLKNIEVVKVRPSKSKLNAVEFMKVTGWQGRTNSEKRDAAILVYAI